MNTIYWTSTTIIVCFLLVSSYSYFFSKSTIEGLRDLGFPDFFRIQLGVLKIIALVVILLPIIPDYIKEWGYAGVGFFLITAMVAHISHRDSILLLLLLFFLFSALAISRYSMYTISS